MELLKYIIAFGLLTSVIGLLVTVVVECIFDVKNKLTVGIEEKFKKSYSIFLIIPIVLFVPFIITFIIMRLIN